MQDDKFNTDTQISGSGNNWPSLIGLLAVVALLAVLAANLIRPQPIDIERAANNDANVERPTTSTQ